MHPEQFKSKKKGLAKYRRLIYTLFALVSFVYIVFGYKRPAFYYNFFIVAGCLLIGLLFISYTPKEKLVKWLENNKGEDRRMTWFVGTLVFCLPYFFLMPQLLKLRQKTELSFCETRTVRAHIISSGKYFKWGKKRRNVLFDYYVIQYATAEGVIEQEIAKEDAYFWGNEIPVRYSVLNPDLFEVIPK